MIAHVINMNHRADRLQEILTECIHTELELVRHEGVNGQEHFIEQFTTKRMRGHAGCWQSHVNVLNAVKGTGEYHLILEDDAVLIDGFKDKVKAYMNELPVNCGLVYFGGNLNVIKKAVIDYNDSFFQAFNVLATHCYVIRDSHIDALLEVLNTRIYKVDVLFTEYQNKHLSLMSKECLSWQRESLSDISFKMFKLNTRY